MLDTDLRYIFLKRYVCSVTKKSIPRQTAFGHSERTKTMFLDASSDIFVISGGWQALGNAPREKGVYFNSFLSF